jgi:hypothetical protein
MHYFLLYGLLAFVNLVIAGSQPYAEQNYLEVLGQVTQEDISGTAIPNTTGTAIPNTTGTAIPNTTGTAGWEIYP